MVNRTGRYAKAAKAAAEAVGANGKHEAAPEPWSDPVPFGRPGDVPPFPTAALPPWLRSWVEAEAEATQTPPDLAACLALACAGAALARKVRVRIRDDWTEPANVFAVVSLPPGERKSAVFADAKVPLQEYELEERQRMAPIIAEAQSEHRIMEAKLKGLEQKAAKAEDSEEAAQLRQQAKDLAKELAAHRVPEEPQLYCDDVTPEKLVQLIVRQGGRMLQASDEGTAFEIAKGRYSDTANFDVYLQGHAGGELRSGRVNRDSEAIAGAALSCALAVQPDVIRGLAEQASMRGRGFLARWLYSLPTSKVGKRKTAPPGMPEEVRQGYREGMLALWRLPRKVGLGGLECSWELELSGAADAVIGALERWLEPQLADGEPLSALAGWANKLAGACARLSLILHMAGTLAAGLAWNEPIEPRVAEAAVTLGRDYFLPHAQAAFGLMGADGRAKDATRVVGWLAAKSESLKVWKRGERIVSRADIHTNVFGGSRTVDDVSAICRLLIEHGFLRNLPGPWRRDSQTYVVYPRVKDVCEEP